MVTEQKHKNWFRKHWIISIILGFIVLLIIGAIMSPEESGQTEKSSDVLKQTLFNVGETFIVDDVAFRVNKVTKKTIVGEYFLDTLFGAEADGVFYIIDLTIENKAKESKDLFFEGFVILDNQGRSFDSDSEAEIYYDEDGKGAITFGQQLQPDLSISGVKIFDLPQTAQGLKLEITCCGLLSTKTVKVDLGF